MPYLKTQLWFSSHFLIKTHVSQVQIYIGFAKVKLQLLEYFSLEHRQSFNM